MYGRVSFVRREEEREKGIREGFRHCRHCAHLRGRQVQVRWDGHQKGHDRGLKVVVVMVG